MRKKNPYVTLLMFACVLGFGYAAYHYLYVERIHLSEKTVTLPADRIERLRVTVAEALSSEDTFDSLSGFTWREGTKRFRIDVALTEGAGVPLAKRLASRVNDLVMRGSDGYPAEVAFLVLGREIYHYVP